MTIQFVKDYRTRDGKPRKRGEIIAIDDAAGRKLIQAGVAKERPPMEPTERK